MAIGVGTGLYTTSEVSRLTGLSRSRVRRWISGYKFKSHGSERRSGPVVLRDAADGDMVTFLDLVEILFVRAFLEHGVTMNEIRRASVKAIELYGGDHPFAVHRFETDGKEIFARISDKRSKRKRILGVVGGHLSFEEVVAPCFKQIDFRASGDAIRWWPLGKRAPVMLDPQIAFGAPVTKTAHVPTFAIGAALASGESPRRVAKWFEIPVRDVKAAGTLERHQIAA